MKTMLKIYKVKKISWLIKLKKYEFKLLKTMKK